jgi:hypothetical protein
MKLLSLELSIELSKDDRMKDSTKLIIQGCHMKDYAKSPMH